MKKFNKTTEFKDYIRIDRKGDLLLFKYSTKFFYDSLKYKDKVKWTPAMREMRGIVVDSNNWEVVSRPYPKFFNLALDKKSAEHPEAYIGNLPQDEPILATEKKDGVLIIVSNYKGKLLIHTAGSLDERKTPYISMAKSMLTKKQKSVIKMFPEYTFMFELITPQTRVVIDYGKEKALYLTGIRNLRDGKLYTHDSCVYQFFGKYFKILPVITFKNIKEAVKAREDKTLDIEGYVLKIPSTGMLLKLKTENYFKHYIAQRKLGILSLYKLYHTSKSAFKKRIESVTDEEFRDYIEKIQDFFIRFDEKFSNYKIEHRIEIIKKKFPKTSVGNNILDDIKKIDSFI